MGYGVIGSTTDSGSVSLGSSPCTPALIARRFGCGARFGEKPPHRYGFLRCRGALSNSGAPARAPLCSGLARRPLKAVARVRIPSGLHLQTPRFPGGFGHFSAHRHGDDVGPVTQPVHNSASRGVQTVGDLVELVREQVPIQVERHGRGLVPEHLLSEAPRATTP
jgi:hypothetical protein